MPNKKVDKQDIINACINLLRSQTPLSARNIAKFLNCSTQPIYYLYNNMQDMEPDIITKCRDIFNVYFNKFAKEKNIHSYKAYGLAFIEFAKTEKGLFKHIYLDKHISQKDNLFNTLLQENVLKSISNLLNISIEEARNFHTNMSIFTFGLAMMQYFDNNLTTNEISEALTQEFNALIKLNNEKFKNKKGE